MSNEKRMLELLEKTFFCENEHHGATDAEIEAAGTQMIARLSGGDLRVPPIPKDYAAFLKLTDGYAWNGVTFFSTKPTPMDERYTNPSLYDKNEYYLRMKSALNGCLVVGSFDDDLYVYSSRTGKYHALDELTLIPTEDDGFDDFPELFVCAVNELYDSCYGDEDEYSDEESEELEERRMQYLLEKTFFCSRGQHGATDEMIEAADTETAAQVSARDRHGAPIPEDYADFLRLTNGYFWNGVCFYSTEPTPMGPGYTNWALAERNAHYLRERPELNGCLVVGECQDDLYVYSSKTGLYHALDGFTMLTLEGGCDMEDDECAFGSFTELFNYAVEEMYYYCYCTTPEKKKEYCEAIGVEYVPNEED